MPQTRFLPHLMASLNTPAHCAALWLFVLLFCTPLLRAQTSIEQAVTTESPPNHADERNINRDDFAAPGQLTWTQLTDFEQHVLSQFTSTINSTSATYNGPGSAANKLLALYLLASGDVRDSNDALLFQQQIDDFFLEHDDVLRERDERERGALLLQYMHHYFLRADERSPLAAYDEDQSRLSELLRSGIYNCISSALLYLVLAESAGLTTAGVVMPSHAFVQVTLPDGRVADVETTAADGFDVVRSQAFFDRNAGDWFESRRLVVPSFADYEQRRVVSAAGLGFDNLWSQHTMASRMNYADRMRLAEIRGVLQSAQPDAQHNRLVYYYREAQFLRNQNDLPANDLPAMDKLMTRINPFLAEFSNVIPSGLFSDQVSAVPLLLLQAERAEWLIRQGDDTNSAVVLAFDVLQQVDSAAMNADVIRDLAYRALNTHVLTLLSNTHFSEARALIERLPADCPASAFCINALEQYYVLHGREYWQQQNWPRTIGLYEEYLARGLQSDNAGIFVNNLETAYLNQAEQHWFDEEREEAQSILEVCIIKAPQSGRCQQRLQAARHNR